MTATEAYQDFLHVMREAGLECADFIIADGRIHRFHVTGDKPNSGNGWYVLHSNGHGMAAGAFGSWKTEHSETWNSRVPSHVTEDELKAWRLRVQQVKEQVQQDIEARQTDAAREAHALWNELGEASPAHPYLQRKQIQPYGIRQEKGRLVIPLWNATGDLKSLQYIDVDGNKRFFTGGAVQGNYYAIGELQEIIYVGEGFATMASVHEATGHGSVVAFNSGNLEPVAQSLRKQYPTAKIILAADNDKWTQGNPGVTKATAAAKAIQARLVIPQFANLDTKPTDFNDLHYLEGPNMVTQQLKQSSPACEFFVDDAGEKGTDLISFNSYSPKWPELEEPALHGIAGDLVKTLAPFTESDQVTLLVHLLAEFSCIVGRNPFIILDGDNVYPTFWPVVVGDTSKSRKGSGSKRVKRLYQRADPNWTRGKHSGSLSSGEGLIYAVRDAEWGHNAKGESIVKDEGLEDKRLYLVQSEFGAMLRVMAREGNSLSGHIRDAWDGETLKPMTKGNRIQATNPHVVVVGHVTKAELLRNLHNTEMSNGFGNRFVWFCVKRSKNLPFAEDPPEGLLEPLIGRLQKAVQFGREAQEVGMTEEARVWWRELYAELSEPILGLAGSLLDRAEAQVRRIASLYALLDCKPNVGIEHLYGAMALWNYSVASVQFLYGEKCGDPIADNIFNAIGKGPLSDSDISALFVGNVSATRLDQAKKLLADQKKIFLTTEKTPGRSKNIWKAYTKETKKTN